MSETVHHPPHYGGDTPFETIKVLTAWLTPEQLYGFCIGNALKYLSRAGRKSSDPLEDLRKARWYLDYILAQLYASKPALSGSGRASDLIYLCKQEAQSNADALSLHQKHPHKIEPVGDKWRVVRAS